jgi:hypothetical protein
MVWKGKRETKKAVSGRINVFTLRLSAKRLDFSG